MSSAETTPIALDATDARLLLELVSNPRATGVELATRLGLSRNTVQARLARWEAGGFLPRLPESLDQLDLLLLTVANLARSTRTASGSRDCATSTRSWPPTSARR